MNIFLYQIQYNQQTKPDYKSGLLTFDCRKNPEFLKREAAHFIRFYDEVVAYSNSNDYFGLFSPKFSNKMNIDINDVNNFIINNPDKEIYMFNPFPTLAYTFMNVWEQGELYHPGLIKISNELINKSNIEYKISDTHWYDVDRTIYCNYWVGRKSFFDKYIIFLKEMDYIVNTYKNIGNKVFTYTNYNTSINTCFYPFIFERLLSTYLFINKDIKSLSFNNYSEMKDILGKINYSFLCSQYRKNFDKWIKNASNNEIKNEIEVIKKILSPSTSNIGLIRSLLRKKNRFKLYWNLF